MFSQDLIISLLSIKFSKTADLFEISIWYRFLTSRSFGFPRLNLSPSNFFASCLLTDYLPQALQPPDYDQYHSQRPWKIVHRVYSNSISRLISMGSIWLWVFPSGGVQVYLRVFRWRNIMLLATRFFVMAKFTNLTALSFLFWCRLSFPIFGLKISSLPTLY